MFWIHATTTTRIVEGFKTIADNVKLRGRDQPKADILHLVYNWLSIEQHGKWLMILDSADDENVMFGANQHSSDGRPLADFLPQSRNGSIIITTRDRSLAFRLTDDYSAIFDIGPMKKEEALMLFKNKASLLSDINDAADLVQMLDLIPLAISQAAAYIQNRAPRSSIKQYINEFRENEDKRVKLLSYDAGGLRRDLRQHGGASNAILTTWKVTFDFIRSKRPSAADLLSLMSFFDRQGIPETILKRPRNVKDTSCSSKPEEKTRSESDDSEDFDISSNFEDDVATLRDYSMIILAGIDNTFEMHGLVQLSTKIWLKHNGLEEYFLNQYVILMDDSFPSGRYETWETCRSLFAHVEAAIRYRPRNESTRTKWANLLRNGAYYALLQDRYTVAEKMALEAKKTHGDIFGSESEEALESTLLLASVLSYKRLYAEAEKLVVQTIVTLKSKLGKCHSSTLACMAFLTSIYRYQGRWKEAEKLELQMTKTWKSKLVADLPITLNSLITNPAIIFWAPGRLEEAEKLLAEVMDIRKSTLGADHLDTLICMVHLAIVLNHRGRGEEALDLMEKCAQRLQKVLGEEHPHTILCVSRLEAWRK